MYWARKRSDSIITIANQLSNPNLPYASQVSIPSKKKTNRFCLGAVLEKSGTEYQMK